MMCEESHLEPDPEPHRKNGRQMGIENVNRLGSYIADLRASGVRLPSRNGQPDKSAIALACGFNRQTLYNNPEAVALLEQAVLEIGLEEGPSTIHDGKAMHMQRQVDRRDRRIQQLEDKLQTVIAENQAIRRENKELKEQVRQYTLMEEFMTTNGRKYRA